MSRQGICGKFGGARRDTVEKERKVKKLCVPRQVSSPLWSFLGCVGAVCMYRATSENTLGFSGLGFCYPNHPRGEDGVKIVSGWQSYCLKEEKRHYGKHFLPMELKLPETPAYRYCYVCVAGEISIVIRSSFLSFFLQQLYQADPTC